MSNAITEIDHEQLHDVTGGALMGRPTDVRTGARVLDALAPDSVSLERGGVGVGWNLPERPVSNLLDTMGVPQTMPKPQQPAAPSSPWQNALRNAIA